MIRKKKREKTNRQKNMFTTKEITRIAMMIAFVSAMSYVRIPLPFSDAAITGQTLAVNVVALLFAPKEAFAAMLCYWLLGLVGVPVFGGMAGAGKLFGPGGGYFMAFIPAVVWIGKWKGKNYNLRRYLCVTLMVGLFLIDGMGFLWLKFITGASWRAAFVAGVLAFVPLDIVKCVIACLVVKPLSKALSII